jgi:hypothetical protein
MHCQISIFELKMMVKIGVIFMPFSNPTCHFRGTADFTRLRTVDLPVTIFSHSRSEKLWIQNTISLVISGLKLSQMFTLPLCFSA